MNEKVKSIALECYNPYGNFDLDKFAKLCIMECVKVCDKIYFERYPDAEDFERSEEGDAIKKHFGVK